MEAPVEAWWESACVLCGAPGHGRLCPPCRGPWPWRVGWRLEGVAGGWVLGDYESGPARAVRKAKRQGDRGLARALAQTFARRMGPVVGTANWIVPAPSSPRSLFARGFAVAPMMADALGAASGVPVAHVLTRRGGRRQSAVGDRAARLANLRGRVRCDTVLTGRVVLVDDVVTTGATAEACVRELLGAGAQEVWLAAVCRVARRPVGALPGLTPRTRAPGAPVRGPDPR